MDTMAPLQPNPAWNPPMNGKIEIRYFFELLGIIIIISFRSIKKFVVIT